MSEERVVSWDEAKTMQYMYRQRHVLMNNASKQHMNVNLVRQEDGSLKWEWTQHMWLPIIDPNQDRITKLVKRQITFKLYYFPGEVFDERMKGYMESVANATMSMLLTTIKERLEQWKKLKKQ